MALAKRLADDGYRVTVYDPQALGSAAAVLRDTVTPAQSLEDCVRQADLLIVTTAWAEFQDLPLRILEGRGEKLTIVDCWRILDPRKYESLIKLIYPGKGPVDDRQPALDGIVTGVAGG